jgi:hypothetical protein
MMTPQVRIKVALVLINVSIPCMNSGCAESNIRVANEPTFSKLAGRWSAPSAEAQRSFTGDSASGSIQEPAARDDRIVFITILADGSIDWSRSFFGAAHGIHQLKNVGDEQPGWRSGHYEVLAADYTRSRTSVTIKRTFSNERETQSDVHIFRFALELQEDGSGRFEIQDQSAEKAPEVRALTRDDRHPQHVENHSQLLGKWSFSPDDAMAVLIIREDGTFDWSGTAEAMLAGFHQLEVPGDKYRISNGTDILELVAATYLPDVSRVEIRQTSSSGTSITYDLTARRIDSQRIEASLIMTSSETGANRGTQTLYRSEDATRRFESALLPILAKND